MMAEAEEPKQEKLLRPKQCHKFLQKRLSGAFPQIVQGFISEAEKGSCAHMKLAVELLEPVKSEARRKGSAQRLLEELGGSL